MIRIARLAVAILAVHAADARASAAAESIEAEVPAPTAEDGESAAASQPAPPPSEPSPGTASSRAAAAERSSGPARPPFVLLLTVGVGGANGLMSLHFDGGLEVHRFFAAYSTWAAFDEPSQLDFNGFKAGYVHPLHEYWALFAAAGGGRLRYRSSPEGGAGYTRHGGAILLEGGIALGPFFKMSGLSLAVQIIVPVSKPDMPAGQEVQAPSAIIYMNINPILILPALLCESMQGC